MIIYLKTKKEIEGFKKAGKIAGQILQTLLDSVKVGVTTQQLDELARQECDKANVKPVFLGHSGFPAAICASNNTTLVHGIPDTKPLQNGDVLSIDIGVDVDGFIGDTADTVVVNQNPLTRSEKLQMIMWCKTALFKAIEKAKEGQLLSSVSKEIFNVAKKNGYSVPSEYGGHGISRGEMHAAPFVPNIPDEEHDVTLRAGMIIAIEPMFIMGKNPTTQVAPNGWDVVVDDLSVHCEHTVLVDVCRGIALTERGENGY